MGPQTHGRLSSPVRVEECREHRKEGQKEAHYSVEYPLLEERKGRRKGKETPRGRKWGGQGKQSTATMETEHGFNRLMHQRRRKFDEASSVREETGDKKVEAEKHATTHTAGLCYGREMTWRQNNAWKETMDAIRVPVISSARRDQAEARPTCSAELQSLE